MTAPLLSIRDLGKTYPLRGRGFRNDSGRRLVAVDRVSFDLMPGEILGLVGESGCGKSTLARLIGRLEPASHGRIGFGGRDLGALPAGELRRLRPRFQPVFQDPLGSLNPRHSVARLLSEALAAGAAPLTADGVTEALRRVGLGPELRDRYPHQLSGGQRQRLGLARALATRPDLLIADEPLSSLDVSIQAQILNLILDAQRDLRLGLLFISHDLRVVGHVSDRVLIMYLGRILEEAPTADLFARPLHPYTRALFASLPALAPGLGRRRAALAGEPPSPVDPRPGCRFFGRCPEREEACLGYENELLDAGSGRRVACRRWSELAAR